QGTAHPGCSTASSTDGNRQSALGRRQVGRQKLLAETGEMFARFRRVRHFDAVTEGSKLTGDLVDVVPADRHRHATPMLFADLDELPVEDPVQDRYDVAVDQRRHS